MIKSGGEGGGLLGDCGVGCSGVAAENCEASSLGSSGTGWGSGDCACAAGGCVAGSAGVSAPEAGGALCGGSEAWGAAEG